MNPEDREAYRMVWPGYVSLVVPRDWTVSEESDLISICDCEAGSGAIQLSFLRRTLVAKPTEAEAIALIERLCRQRGWPELRGAIRTARVAGSPAAEVTFEDDDDGYWRVWYVVSRSKVVLLTYTCERADASREADLVRAVVDSLRWDSDTPGTN